MSDTDKNQALTIVIEKLTEIVGNISQDGMTVSPEKSSGRTSPKVSVIDNKSKETLDLQTVHKQDEDTGLTSKSADRVKELHVCNDKSEVMEISMEQGDSPNQVVINLPVKVGNMNITNTEGLLRSLKQLDHGLEAAKERKDEADKVKDLYQCSKCEYSSHNKHYLKQHVDLVHIAERPFKCPLCDYAGKRSHSLKEHLVVHSPFRPFMCHFCSASFRKKGHLTNHIKLHASEQAVACTICKHFIANRNELSRHLRHAHVGCQVFLCHMCEYATTSEGNIVSHMHTHGNPTVYCCSGCRFIGVHEEIIKKHVQTHHNGEGSFTVSTSVRTAKPSPVVLLKCSECGFTTSEREVMKSHMYENHLICLANKSMKTGSPSVQQSVDTTGPSLQKMSDPGPSPTDVKSEDESAKVISGGHNSRPNFCDEEDAADQLTNISTSQDNTDEEAQLPERSETSKWRDAVLVKVGSGDGGRRSGQVSYMCTSCKYSCKEAVQFIVHMLSHAPTNDGKKNKAHRQAADNEVMEDDFLQDKFDGLYCCLICGYACDHQRTIKAHIWKHSGHKDINYPTFQNGPLSMYEELSSDSSSGTKLNASGVSANNFGSTTLHVLSADAVEEQVKGDQTQATSESDCLKSDYVLSAAEDHGQTMLVTSEINHPDTNAEHLDSDSDGLGKKRKLADHKLSEMDVSMPKLRILSSGGQGLVVDSQVSSSDDSGSERRLSADEQGTLSRTSRSPVVHCNGGDNTEVYVLDGKTTEDMGVVAEEVVESEDIVEIVVETSDGKLKVTSGNETAGQHTLLDKQHVTSSNDRTDDASISSNSSLQINEQGISSSLLAVIEQFRKDSSPGCDKNDGKAPSYKKIDDLYICCQCQQTSSSITDIQSHVRAHTLPGTRKSEPNPVSDKNDLHSLERTEGGSSSFTATDGQCQCPETPNERTRCFFCENCEESFYTVDQLLNHKMKIMCWSKSRGSDESADDKDCFKCNFCDFVGMSVRSVKSHMKRHWNDLRASKRMEVDSSSEAKKYFVCERCTSVFSNVLDLLAHNSSSCSVVQMPRCTKCNFVTSNSEFLKKHMNCHHNQDKLYKCEMCDFVSKSYNKIDNHVKKHIEPCDLHCDLCDFVATSVRSLKSHMKRHTNDQRFVRQPLEQYKCNMCGYICHHLPALKSHMWRHASESNYSYEKTNAVINAAIEDGTQLKETTEKALDCIDKETLSGTSQYSTVTVESDLGDSLIAFRCCHCFFETCIKKELNEHMKQHMDIIQKTMEVNNELFCGTFAKDASTEDMVGI